MMKQFFTVVLVSITSVLLGLLLYFEVGLIVTRKYTVAFIDPLEMTNMILIGISTIIGITISSNIYLKTKRSRVISIASFSVVIIGLSTIVASMLNKSDKEVYYQDLGVVHSYYLYLNSQSKNYILERTYPFGKTTFVGHYDRTDNEIKLDSDIAHGLTLNGFEYGPVTSLSLDNMEKIK